MQTWVLLLFLSGHSTVVVPGYLTESECHAAFAALQKSGDRAIYGHRCFPGPEQRGE